MPLDRLILNLASQTKAFGSADVLKTTQNKYSRQYISRILQELVRDGKLVKSGSTRNSLYSLPENSLWTSPQITQTLNNKNLEEDRILQDLTLRIPGFRTLPQNVRQLFNYSFSEMLNNAIEHSYSSKIDLLITANPSEIGFKITDRGIGVFASVMTKIHLASEIDAVQDILKGKTTTDPSRHSGEGLFFTSKTADLFTIESHHTRLKIDNLLPDVFIEPLTQNVPGTIISWQVNTASDKNISDIFAGFQSSSDTFKFDQTSVLVRLYTLNTQYISRSQARRLLTGLDKFMSITLDFDRVTTVGQAFADEIFRVFAGSHPDIKIQYLNAIPEVEIMLKRSQTNIRRTILSNYLNP
jgi:hypothetical protein